MDSVVELNNRGVQLMMDRDDRYVQVARLFQWAFKMWKTTMKEHMASRPEEEYVPSPTNENGELDRRGDDGAGDEVVLASATRAEQRSIPSTGATVKYCQQRKRALLDTAQESRLSPAGIGNKAKRQRKSTPLSHYKALTNTGIILPAASPAMTVTGAVLGRPLWLGTPAMHRSPTHMLQTYGASILYNYAYALHRLIIGSGPEIIEQRRDKQLLLLRKEVMRVYREVIRLSVRGVAPVVHWVASHNLQFLVAEEAEHDNQSVVQAAKMYSALEANKIGVWCVS